MNLLAEIRVDVAEGDIGPVVVVVVLGPVVDLDGVAGGVGGNGAMDGGDGGNDIIL